jgi:DNA repair protein RecN (Recombination protein N)
MLEQLSVRNFAIIEQIDLELSAGMTVFSGETGAGKSLIVDALGFLLGARADSSIIREGAAECVVSGLFSVSNAQDIARWLGEREIEWRSEETILLRRTMKQNGRSLAWIQDRQVSRNELVEFTQYLVDIHGQHEHQRLIDPATHIDMLDAYAALGQELQSYASAYAEWRNALQEYRDLLDQKAKRSQEADYLDFVAKEIAAVKPKPNEDEQLEAEEKILSQHEKLFGAISEAASLLGAGEGSDVLHALRRIRADIENARAIDSRLGGLAERLAAAYYELEDVSESIREYQANLRFDPARLERIEQRLAELQKLKRKYGPQLSDVFDRYERARATLETLTHADENLAELEQRVKTLKERVFSAALNLSEKRLSAAVSMSSSIEEIIRKLGMPDARVYLRVTRAKDETGAYRATSRGIDDVEFYIAPNPGEPERPLSRIASGGELSRFALALKAVLAAHDVVDTLVFDEIDTGIGGQVGVAVGEYLKQLSQYRQVLCVTHLATIAAQADQQYKVDKQVSAGRTSTSLRLLSRQEREAEIARMLSGSAESEVSRTHAAELLNQTRPQKFL